MVVKTEKHYCLNYENHCVCSTIDGTLHQPSIPKTQEKLKWKCKRWGMGSSIIKCWALDLTWLLHTWFNNLCGYPHKVCMGIMLVKKPSNGLGRGFQSPILNWKASFSWWLLGERESFFFWSVALECLPYSCIEPLAHVNKGCTN